MSIGATTFAHNALTLDYCWEACLSSLLPICNQISVLDCDSTDGTFEWLREFAKGKPTVSVRRAIWQPNRHGEWLSELGNHARSFLKTDWHLHLQADEVLHEDDYDVIQTFAHANRPMLFERYNFWLDAKHIAARGHLCGNNVLRGGPIHVPLVGDAENLSPEFGELKPAARIFHVGFIRKTEAMIEKSIGMETAFWGNYNPIFDRMKKEGRDALKDWIPARDLIEFKGSYPAVLRPWLRERGWL